MKFPSSHKQLMLTGVAIAALVSGCGGDSSVTQTDTVTSINPALVSSVDKQGEPTPASALSEESNKFSFAATTLSDDGVSISIPEGPLPAFSSRKTIQAGDGDVISYGDSVTLSYDMFSWSTGELVDSSSAIPTPLTFTAGGVAPVPNFLAESVIGRKVGEKMQVIFEAGMEDLPVDYDRNDAYVLVVELTQ